MSRSLSGKTTIVRGNRLRSKASRGIVSPCIVPSFCSIQISKSLGTSRPPLACTSSRRSASSSRFISLCVLLKRSDALVEIHRLKRLHVGFDQPRQAARLGRSQLTGSDSGNDRRHRLGHIGGRFERRQLERGEARLAI